MIKPFKLRVPNKTINEIYNKVKKYPWTNIQDMNGWEHGTNFKYLKEISKYWVTKFNWRKQERKINKFSNYLTKVDGINIHFIKEKGSGSNPMPLLILHGWPGSIVEFLNIIEKLSHPERFGGKKEDSFDVIAPSLPGFGFSGSSKKPIGPRKMAKIMNKFMTKNLGYKKYLSQGGDWGSTISNWLGYDHSKSCRAIHINFLSMRLFNAARNKQEKNWEKRFKKDQIIEEGYRTQQATKPQTLSYAMMDSPVGVAAWIIEKMRGWSDIKNGDIESVYSKDILLSNIMVYLVTKTFNTASWIYYGRREEGGRFLPKDHLPLKVPTAIAKFPKEYLEWAPKSYVERIYNVQQWTEMSSGGLFVALEQPNLLIKDIRKFAKSL